MIPNHWMKSGHRATHPAKKKHDPTPVAQDHVDGNRVRAESLEPRAAKHDHGLRRHH